MNTNWRFRNHRGFQHDAAVVIGVSGAVGALAWALPLAGATWWMMMAVGSLLLLLSSDGGQHKRRRHLITAATAALGAVLAGATWRALTGGVEVLVAGDALLIGLLAGLASASALVLSQVERIVDAPLAGALAEARATLGGPAVAERALAERAAIAHDRIVEGLGGDGGALTAGGSRGFRSR